MENISELPQKEELIAALAEQPLGMGEEAQVYKIHTRPQYTMRVSPDLLSTKVNISQAIGEAEVVLQEDIFMGRMFGQTVAYFNHPDLIDAYSKDPLITINYYSPGHDYTIVKNPASQPTPEETLGRTIAITKMLVDPNVFPDRAYDSLCDKLKFLSSRQFTIDVGNELFSNTGNILPSVQDHQFFIIDIKPFYPAADLRLATRPHLNPEHTKGFNSPFFLSRGLLYGYRKHHTEYGTNLELLDLRIRLLNRIVDSAMRSNLDDSHTYMFHPETVWKRQLTKLNVPEDEQKKLLDKLGQIQDNQPYRVTTHPLKLARIGDWYERNK